MTNENENVTRRSTGRAAPRRGGVRRALVLILVLAVVLGGVLLASYKDLHGFDSIRRLLSYNKVSPDAEGKAELYTFDSDRSNTFALLGERLLVVSTTRMALLADDGTEVFAQNVKLANPAIAQGGQMAAVYDVGGTALYLVGEKGLVRDMSDACEGGVFSASLNSSDYLALTLRKSGYKSAVTVYDSTLEPVFTYNSSEHYVMDACVLRDNKHLAVVTLGEADSAFASQTSIYALDQESPVAVNTLNSSLVLSLNSLGDSLLCVTDDRLTSFHADGSLTGSYRYEYPYLRSVSVSGDYAALLLSRYRSGSALRIATVGADGEVLGTRDERREVLGISAAGKYVAVLYGESLTIFTSDMAEYATLERTNYAKEVIMRADGTAVLIGSSSATLFIP